MCSSFFFFNDTATTEIYTLSLHDALPIYHRCLDLQVPSSVPSNGFEGRPHHFARDRSEEHTSELQSQSNLVCRLLLEKKKQASSLSGEPSTTKSILITLRHLIISCLQDHL